MKSPILETSSKTSTDNVRNNKQLVYWFISVSTLST